MNVCSVQRFVSCHLIHVIMFVMKPSHVDKEHTARRSLDIPLQNLNHVSMLSRVWWNVSLDRGPIFPGYREDWRRGTCGDPQRTKGHSWVPKLTLENVLLDQDQP